MSQNFQDWETVVFTKPKTTQKKKTCAPSTGGTSSTVVAVNTTNNKNGRVVETSRLRKLDNAEEAGKIKTVSHSLSLAIARARQDKGMKQKELATRLNVKHTVIQGYESGKAVPDGRLLTQMEKVLGTRLRGGSNKK